MNNKYRFDFREFRFLNNGIKENEVISDNNNKNASNVGLEEPIGFRLKRNTSSSFNDKEMLKKLSFFFGYTFFDCFKHKNNYFYKLRAVIKKDLSIENILNTLNSQDIIINMLQENNLIQAHQKANFFDKLNKLHWKATQSEG